MKPEAQPLRPHLLRSVLLHSLLVLLICGLLYQAGKAIEDQEQAFIEDVRAQEEALKQAEKEAAEETMKEALADQVTDEFEEVIEQELDMESADAIQEALDEQVADWINQATEEMPLHEMTSDEQTELAQQLREQSMDELQKQLDQMKKDMLLAMVRDKIENEVAPNIKRNIEQELKNNTGEQLKKQLEKKAKEANKERMEDLKEALQDTQKELKELAKKQKQVQEDTKNDKKEDAQKKQEEINEKIAALDKKLEDTLEKVQTLAPKANQAERLSKEMDKAQKETNESKEALAKDDKKAQAKEAQDAVRQLEQASKTIDQLSKQFSDETKSRELSEADKQAIDEILPELEEKAREKVTEAVTEESVPLAAKKLTEALKKQLDTLDLNNDDFKKELEKEIKEALDKDLSEQSPEAAISSQRSKEMIKRRDPKEIEEAREDIKKALDKLETVKKQQDALAEETIRETASKDAQEELAIKDQITDAKKEAKKALDEAGKVSLKTDHALKAARKDIENKTAEVKAKEASNFVKQEFVEQAKESMKKVSNELDKKINRLKSVDKSLAQEQAALEKMQEVAKDLEAMLGKKEAAELKDSMEAEGEKSLEAFAKADVKKATEKTKIDGDLDEFNKLESMQELSEMMADAEEAGRSMDNAGELMAELEAGVLGPGAGSGAGTIPGSGQRLPGLGRGYGYFNRKLYEEFSKDMRDRLNPKKAYEDQEEQEGMESKAEAREGETAASMVILKVGDEQEAKSSDESKDEERTVPKPNFKSIVFGAAEYAIDPIKVDGDLKDWGELKHPQKHQFEKSGKEVVGPTVHMRWSPKGLYFCYVVKDTNKINNNGPAMWQVTGMELFIDVRNWRKDDMLNSPTSQQIFFCPFGWSGNPQITFGESGRGHRGLKMWGRYPDVQGLRGRSAAKLIPGGYQVECFIKRTALGQPILAPGMYLAINHSVNIGNGYETQWSAPKSVTTWNNPDTWGDVLLLGSDARVAFKHYEDAEKALPAILPGDPVRVEITDPDMNLYDIKYDRIIATVKLEGSQTPLLLVLKETKPNSGVFAGSFSTQSYFKPAKENTLNVRGGNHIILSYTDARAGYGEKDRKVTAKLAVAWPVTKLGKQ